MLGNNISGKLRAGAFIANVSVWSRPHCSPTCLDLEDGVSEQWEREWGRRGATAPRGGRRSAACIPDSGTYSRKQCRFFKHHRYATRVSLQAPCNVQPLRNTSCLLTAAYLCFQSAMGPYGTTKRANRQQTVEGRNCRGSRKAPNQRKAPLLLSAAPVAVENGSKPIYSSEEC